MGRRVPARPVLAEPGSPGWTAPCGKRASTPWQPALDRSALTSDEARLDRDGVAVVIGNEGSGLSTEMIEACGKTVFIPISARSESLNASVAASIFLWEMRRRG